MTENTMTDPMQHLGTQLLTGIPNDVTLREIVPNLPWIGGHLLRTVSNDWQRAFQSGMIYDARVSAQATEKFLLAFCELNPMSLDRKYKILLHSTNQDCWYKLPSIPGFPSGLPYNCQCVPLNGRIYVLGGAKHLSDDSGIRDVYVLDLAGQEPGWKQCKCLQVPRLQFGVGVMDGKIFVIGGTSGGRLINRCEMYDPKVDVWSEMQRFNIGIHNGEPGIDIIGHVMAMGKELVLFGVQPGVHRGVQFSGILRNDLSADEAEHLLISEEDDPSDDEAAIQFISEAKDPLVSEDDLDDTLDDVTWIKMIDPDLFSDDVSGDSLWFHEDIKKHGFHQILEEHWLPDFNDVIENGVRWRFKDMKGIICYVVYDTEEDKWRVDENLSTYDTDSIRSLARPLQTPFSCNWQSNWGNDLVYSELWQLNL